MSPCAQRWPVRASMLWLVFALVCGAPEASAQEAPGEVRRLQRERDHQQSDLRLRMQQQQERAALPVPDAAEAAQRRTLEHEGERRLRQGHDERERRLIAPDPGGAGVPAGAAETGRGVPGR